MANRCLLHITHLEPFKEYCREHGIYYRPGKGEYQVLQVMTPKGWKVIFRRLDMPEHYTVNDELVPILKRFIHFHEAMKYIEEE